MALCPPNRIYFDDADISFADRNTCGVAAMIEDFWSTDPEYIEWLDSQEEQDDE